MEKPVLFTRDLTDWPREGGNTRYYVNVPSCQTKLHFYNVPLTNRDIDKWTFHFIRGKVDFEKVSSESATAWIHYLFLNNLIVEIDDVMYDQIKELPNWIDATEMAIECLRSNPEYTRGAYLAAYPKSIDGHNWFSASWKLRKVKPELIDLCHSVSNPYINDTVKLDGSEDILYFSEMYCEEALDLIVSVVDQFTTEYNSCFPDTVWVETSRELIV